MTPAKNERGRYADSMIKKYPQLLDLKYFKYLENKTKIPNTAHYEYNIKKIPLSYREFKRLVSMINDSGFWKLPYRLPEISESMDGYGLSLEANTKSKYNFVSADCDCDPKSSFFSICKEIVKCAGLEKQIDIFSSHSETSKPAQVFVQDVQLADLKEPDPHVKKIKKHKK